MDHWPVHTPPHTAVQLEELQETFAEETKRRAESDASLKEQVRNTAFMGKSVWLTLIIPSLLYRPRAFSLPHPLRLRASGSSSRRGLGS